MIQTLAAGKAIGIDLKNHNNAIHLFEQDCKILISGPFNPSFSTNKDIYFIAFI